MSNPYVSFTWVDRDSEYPNRRKLVDTTTQEEKQYYVSRDEGTVSEQGTPFEAYYMNNLESRVNDAFAKMNVEVSGTLIAGQTTLVLTDSNILSTSTVKDIYFQDVDPYATGIAPTSCVVSTGTITLTFDVLTTDLTVKVWVMN